jgi:PHP family Zn ribbon phosphoesterase
MRAYKYDLHIHSVLSPCGDDTMTPNNIANMAMLCGAQIAALTDHNSTANCPAFFEACHRAGVVPVAGAEINTSEEVHVLCLFPSLDAAMDFDDFLSLHLPNVQNRPDIFGNQFVMDADDVCVAVKDKLLIAATDISIDETPDIAARFGGVAIPAHIDGSAFSLIANLGFIPDSYPFTAYEIRHPERRAALTGANPALNGKRLLFDSDAHTLEALVREPSVIELVEPTAAALIDKLRERKSGSSPLKKR